MPNSEITYGKWGTRIAVADETDQSLQDFCLQASRVSAGSNGWEVLPGPVERVPVKSNGGEPVVAYLWPVARAEAPCAWCNKAGHREEDHPFPAGHAKYDAFYDTFYDRLRDLVVRDNRPNPSDAERGEDR